MSGGWMAVRAIACLLRGSKGSLDDWSTPASTRAARGSFEGPRSVKYHADARPTVTALINRLAPEHASASVHIMLRQCRMPRAGRREREPRKGGNGLDECSVRAAATGRHRLHDLHDPHAARQLRADRALRRAAGVYAVLGGGAPRGP